MARTDDAKGGDDQMEEESRIGLLGFIAEEQEPEIIVARQNSG